MSEPILEETRQSLVFLVPKPAFFMWLGNLLQSTGRSLKNFYFEEENMACVIPSVASFGSTENLTSYLAELKKQLLIKVFGGVVTDWKQCPEISSKTFDEFFELKIRDNLWTAK